MRSIPFELINSIPLHSAPILELKLKILGGIGIEKRIKFYKIGLIGFFLPTAYVNKVKTTGDKQSMYFHKTLEK